MTKRLLVALGIACAGIVNDRVEQTRRFELDLPGGVNTGPTYLVLRHVETPRNVAVVFRAYALRSDTGRVLLGSTAVPAVAPDAKGVTTLPESRINITTGLRRWLATEPLARKVRIEIVSPAADSDAGRVGWRIEAAHLVQPK